MRVFVKTVTPENDISCIRPPVAIGILKVMDIRDAERHRAAAIRINPDGDVETGGKSGDFFGAAVGLKAGKDLDGITGWFVGSSGKRILARLRQPEPAL